MTRYILIHGAWGNASGWARLTPILTAAGHQVQTIDLPGHGADPTPPADVGMQEYTDKVAAVLADGPPAVLVGHSMGGIVISAVAERMPEHVTSLVYVAALLPQDGQSLLDLIKLQDTPGIGPAVRPGPTKGTTVLDPETAGAILFQDADPKAQARALAAMGPQSNKAQKDGVTVTEDRFGTVPRAYVFCTQDNTVTYPLQQQMVRATPCAQTFTLECGHVPQLTQPQALADIIIGI